MNRRPRRPARWRPGSAPAGIPVDRHGLAPHASGADNEVLAARTTEGRDLIVKVPRRPADRYGTAAWAAAALAECGVPAPRVLWHGAWDGGAACVETRCPGIPLTGTPAGSTPPAPRSASTRGRRTARRLLLRKVHAVTVCGYGQLTEARRRSAPQP